MANEDRRAQDIRDRIDDHVKEYETLTGEKLLVRRISQHRPQEIWAWLNSLAHEYAIMTGKKISFQVAPVRSRSVAARDPNTEVDETRSSDQPEGPTLYCSFCGKTQHQVAKLIAGPTVFICDECTVLCMSIIGESEPQPDRSGHEPDEPDS